MGCSVTHKCLLNVNNIGLNLTLDNKLNYHMGKSKYKLFLSIILIIFGEILDIGLGLGDLDSY